MISRSIEDKLREHSDKGKAIIIYGARQVGKTTLAKELFEKEDTLFLNADEEAVRNLFKNVSLQKFKAIIGKNKTVIVDEAQRIEDIGIKLKLITDGMPDVQLVVTGSSSLDIANKVNEPLTGRKFEHTLYPLSFKEMVEENGLLSEMEMLSHRLIFGYYPDVVVNIGEEKDNLREIANSYLYKDILTFGKIRKSSKLQKLLQALAFQVGSEVSYNELSNLCGIDKNTVSDYIEILEQSFIVYRLPSFSRNLRNEIKMGKKIYFWDNGIRNAIIADYRNIDLRNDIGQLFENFFITERIKKMNNQGEYPNFWFWRTKEKNEIDLIEEMDGKLIGYECKWNPKAKIKTPKLFLESYKDAQLKVVNRENVYEELI